MAGSKAGSAELNEFKATLLSFDFYKDIIDDAKVPKEERKEMADVPLHFESEHHYVDTFMPLFWEEAKAQIHRSKGTEMSHSSETARHVAFKSEGEWLRLDLQRDKEEAGQTQYNFADLVILTQGKDPVKEDPVHFLAMVDSSTGVMISVSTRLPKAGVPRALEVAKVISAMGSWQLAKVMNCSTLIREFEGLKAFPKINLKDVIINRDDSGPRDTGTEMQAAPDLQPKAPGAKDGVGAAQPGGEALFHIPQRLEEWLKGKHNDPQQKAINDCRKVSGITLVQGPPGTGKTKTALGILAILMNAKAKEAKAVSYTRTGGAAKHVTGTDGESEDEEATDEAIAKRELERVQLVRSRVPWLRGGYTPWTDRLDQDVPVSGTVSWRLPFPKLKPSEVVPMSEVSEDVAPQKVLVSAPSNAAIDEVLRRVVQDGIVGPDGTPTKPSVVRLGPNVHPSLEEYSLERIVKRRLAALSDAPNLNQREEEKQRLLRDARLVCTTLSISGSRDVVGFEGGFDTVVVDEASQGVEVSMLVPLKLGCRRLILIGDPQQLPATCFSTQALEHAYERSLFQRLQLSQHKVNLLHVQYRMHPAISAFPSEHFYEGILTNALPREEFEAQYPAPWSNLPCFGPVGFFDVRGEQQDANMSYVNDAEADFVIQFFATLSALWPDEPWHSKIAVISPYAEQVKLIRRKFRTLFGLPDKSICPVDVNTVDGFQGREKDCVIVSVVRADTSKSIGFVRDRRRMNVAFTRPRTNLWIVGYVRVLERNEDWREFIVRQREATRLLRVSRPFNTFLSRYVRNYYERHPDLQQPPGKLSSLDDTGAPLEERVDLELSKEQLEEIERREEENAFYQRDIEEVSEDGSESDSEDIADDPGPGEATGDGAPGEDAQDAVAEPAAKRQKVDGDAEGGEEADAGGDE
uniref:Helicase ATP-binding domain-containing protein n=1 Tax=Alexandrium monilatum TaxID=311494 RepID=A0A7S4PU63_9DINO